MGTLQMTNESLIIRYVKAMVSPSRIYQYRHTFSWLHITFLFVFLTACLMVPFSISMMKIDHFQMKFLLPATIEKIDQEFAEQLRVYQLQKGKLTGGSGFYQTEKGTMLAIDMSQKFKTTGENGRIKVNGYDQTIIFQKDHFIMSDQNGTGFSIGYGKKDIEMKDMNASKLKAFIAERWLAQYKPLIMMLTLSLILVSQLFLTGCLTGGIWITKKSKMSGIKSLREAAAIAVGVSTIPIFAAVVSGLIHFDLITMLLIQSFGIILMISFTFRYFFTTRKSSQGGSHDNSTAI
ncbi:DUF1189 family protein [Bacillus sp. CLL-7-23]|uniref:DUF1189 family protein n=1 Tax=Bacillus changyiensis TaxID=3004103 RepID=A0ABT4X642_9BACI|nr:DUF1189 family protein [Bacillus changyiensis]MDA7026827.1 DUF1189 family protein [Bacillus changyiensis]